MRRALPLTLLAACSSHVLGADFGGRARAVGRRMDLCADRRHAGISHRAEHTLRQIRVRVADAILELWLAEHHDGEIERRSASVGRRPLRQIRVLKGLRPLSAAADTVVNACRWET